MAQQYSREELEAPEKIQEAETIANQVVDDQNDQWDWVDIDNEREQEIEENTDYSNDDDGELDDDEFGWEENNEEKDDFIDSASSAEWRNSENSNIIQLKNQLARTQADYQNFKQRTENQKSDMIFFLKQDIFKKILPRLDDLERIIANTPENEQSNNAFVGIKSAVEKLQKDLKSLWVEPFESVGTEMNPDKHEVMTQVEWEEWIVIDEFEKWYELDGKILRHAKVTVGSAS